MLQNPIFQRKPKILQSPGQVPNIQVPQDGLLSHNSVVSTGPAPRLLTQLHILHNLKPP